MKFVVTGGIGFIGSHLVQRLLDIGHDVTIFHNKSFNFKQKFSNNKKLSFIQSDIQNLKNLKNNLKNFDVVAHFAAHASTQTGLHNTDVDIKSGTLTTYNILESMRINGIKKIIFPSAPAVYGEPKKIPTPEDSGMLLPVSLYGAAKLASEGLLSAYSNLFNIKVWIFRLGNVYGPDMKRGVLIDFIKKLRKNPKLLEIYGNGNQRKDVIFIDDCIDGILTLFKKSKKNINLFNLSSGLTISVNEIAKIILKEMNIKNYKIRHIGGKVGWPGDVPTINFDITKAKKVGWSPKYDAKTAIQLSVKGLIQN